MSVVTDMTAETLANELFDSLTAGADFTVPVPDLSAAEFQVADFTGALAQTLAPLTNHDLTEAKIGGTGTFDVLMCAFKAHLEQEYKANRISGAEYTKTYIALTQAAMQNAVQYLLGRDQAYWAAINAQMQARLAAVGLVTARVQLETAKAALVAQRYEALTAKANYALTKLKLSTEKAGFDVAAYQLSDLMPTQKRQLSEQAEAARAQTLNVRSDGSTVAGTLGAQKALYSEQVISYQRDAENKGAKLFTDAWITMKTMDEGLLPPTNFDNAALDVVLTKIRQNLGLV